MVETGDPTINIAAAAALERAVNAALTLDPDALRRIAALSGKVFLVRCTTPPSRLYVIPCEQGLRLRAHHEEAVSCEVCGGAADFVAVFGARDKAAALVNGGLKISGDSAPLLELEKILSRLDLDWEARLAVLIGDAPSHQVGRLVRGSVRFGRSARELLLDHVEEFVHEEARLAPSRAEVEDFLRDLRATEQRGERLEALARRIRRRIAALQRARGSAAS